MILSAIGAGLQFRSGFNKRVRGQLSTFKLPDGEALTFIVDLDASGTTVTTLGLGDVTPLSPTARLITVVETGLGLGLMALVIWLSSSSSFVMPGKESLATRCAGWIVAFRDGTAASFGLSGPPRKAGEVIGGLGALVLADRSRKRTLHSRWLVMRWWI